MKQDLIDIEFQMDNANGNNGSKEGYCIYCKSTEYNGIEGIVHTDKCAMTKIRRLIN